MALGSSMTVQTTSYTYASTAIRLNWLTREAREDPLPNIISCVKRTSSCTLLWLSLIVSKYVGNVILLGFVTLFTLFTFVTLSTIFTFTLFACRLGFVLE